MKDKKTPPKTSLKKANKKLRPFGLAVGEFVVPESFDEPSPEEILAEFEPTDSNFELKVLDYINGQCHK